MTEKRRIQGKVRGTLITGGGGGAGELTRGKGCGDLITE